MSFKRTLLVVTIFLFGVLTFGADEKHQFNADVKKMLQIIISSLYTNRNIVLRELISNGSDAISKIRVMYLTESKEPVNQDGEAPTMDIRIKTDKEARTLTVTDGGVGMTKEDLINNLGSIGTSGTKSFIEKMTEGGDANMIGQFGVGFYSAFLVAERVKVASKNDNDDKQWVWESEADGTYNIFEDPRGNTLGRGTEITLELKKDADEYIEADKLKSIVKQYSEFINFPIYVQSTKTEKKAKEVPKKEEKEEDNDEAEVKDEEDAKEPEMEDVTTHSWDLVNENKPIWTRKPTDITEAEYHGFYKALAKNDHTDPLYYTHFNAEGEVEFKSILYIPGKAPHNLFDHSGESLSNVKLYVRRVFITDEFKDLVPRYLNFLRGVVDSDDLPLNVSRELLQETRILKIIKKKLIRKALSMIKELADADDEAEAKKKEKAADEKEKAADALKDEAVKKEKGEESEEAADEKKEDKVHEPKYPKFWEEFGKSIRLGLIEDSTNRARLTKLLRYYTSKSVDKLISLEDYVEKMPEEQKNIFYLIAENLEKAKESPLLEGAKAQNVEVLLMTDAIDEYVVGHITEFSGKKLINLAKENAKLKEQTDKEKKIESKRKEAWKPFTDWVKKTLDGKVDKVTLSPRVTTTPCVVVSPEYGATANMQRIMSGQALSTQQNEKSKRIMELNHRHPAVDELRRRVKEDENDSVAKDLTILLYEVSSLQSGFQLEDVNDFALRMQRVMKQGLNLDEKAGLVDEEEYDVEEEEEEDEEEEEVKEEAGSDKDEKDEL